MDPQRHSAAFLKGFLEMERDYADEPPSMATLVLFESTSSTPTTTSLRRKHAKTTALATKKIKTGSNPRIWSRSTSSLLATLELEGHDFALAVSNRMIMGSSIATIGEATFVVDLAKAL